MKLNKILLVVLLLHQFWHNCQVHGRKSLKCPFCNVGFKPKELAALNEHIDLHLANPNQLDPRSNERIQTISSERSDPANNFFFNPPTVKDQRKMRTSYNQFAFLSHGQYKFEPLISSNGQLFPFSSKNFRPRPKEAGGIKTIEGDGHCLYRSISYALTGSEEYYQIVRQKVASQLRSSKTFEWVTENIKTSEFNEHVKNVESTNAYGEIVDVIAAAKAFNVNILIFWKQLVQLSNGQKRLKHLWLCYSPRTSSSFDATHQDPNLSTIPLTLFQTHYEVVLAIEKKH